MASHLSTCCIFSTPATSSNDAVCKPGIEAARKQWGQPQMTQIISALGNAKLQTATTTIGPDEPDAGKKAQLPVVTQSSGSSDSSTMGTTVTVQSSSALPLLGVTVVKSPTSESPKTVIVRKDRVDESKEEDNSQAGSTITISAETPDDKRKPVTLETISEGTKEGDKEDATVKAVDAEDLNIEDVEDITMEKAEPEGDEKAAPKNPVKAWGEVKASTPTESRFL